MYSCGPSLMFTTSTISSNTEQIGFPRLLCGSDIALATGRNQSQLSTDSGRNSWGFGSVIRAPGMIGLLREGHARPCRRNEALARALRHFYYVWGRPSHHPEIPNP